MTRLTLPVVCAVLLAVGPASMGRGEEKPAPKAPSLYQRMGGFDTFAAVFDGLGPRLTSDPQFASIFSGHSTDSQIRQRQRVIELLCTETGGPCNYTGKPLKTAHAGLGITQANWSAFLKHMTATLEQLKVGEKEKLEFLALLDRHKEEVVEKP